MIRVNRRTDYAIRVVLALSKQGQGMCVSTAQIQRETLIPRALAPIIVADLARAGFVLTFPGRNGGICLARPAVLINLRQIMELFEEHFTVYHCLVSDEACPFTEKCPIRCRWSRLRGMILTELEQITFDELAREAFLPANVFQVTSEPLRV